MSWYTTKRTLLRPVTAVRRRRSPDLNAYTRALYENHDYRPSMRRFVEATRANPDLLVDVDLPDGAVVLDVGAFRGEWTAQLLRHLDAHGRRDLTVHAFEPEPHAVDRLREGIGQDERVQVHAVGLGGRDRTEALAVGGPGSSVFVDQATPGFLGSTDVVLRDVHQVLDELGVAHVDLAKINIEGGEFELIDRLHESGRLAELDTVVVQFHEFAPRAHAGRRRNRRQLSETHRCTWSYAWVNERWDRR